MKSVSEITKKVQTKHSIIGRESEIGSIVTTILSGRNLLIEGPVGVGKTVLAAAVADILGRKVIRIDGDSRFTEQKLTGWFDPALVLKQGFNQKTFCAGPLVSAMESGSILFINELNRMPEAVQNVLLPAIDEGIVSIPQLGEIKAEKGFLVIATQNPREFVATAHLSEALMDRMEWVQLGYQSFEEEKQIAATNSGFEDEPYLSWAVALVRMTRSHPKIKRGASVRAAIAILKILGTQKKLKHNLEESDFFAASKLALPTRIELLSTDVDGGFEIQIDTVLTELCEELKKKSNQTS